MYNYLNLLEQVINAPVKIGRNGKTYSLFGKSLTFDMAYGFPAVTTKKLAFKQVVAELLFFISGSSDIKDLWRNGCHIWNGNYYSKQWQEKLKLYNLSEDSLGYVYGAQWRNYNGDGIDQLHDLIQGLKNDPYSRRHVVTAWNPSELNLMCLPPCHMGFTCDVQPCVQGNILNMQMNMRSCDIFHGLPFNIASYAILLHMLSQLCNFKPGKLQITMVNVHLYEQHIEAVQLQRVRAPLPLPQLWLNPEVTSIDNFTLEDVKMLNYECCPAIYVPMVE